MTEQAAPTTKWFEVKKKHFSSFLIGQKKIVKKADSTCPKMVESDFFTSSLLLLRMNLQRFPRY